ncbi:MAG: hypothetical protein KDG49_13410 [Geminicoccaceae bacterium]|jgi:hypothetical protein|nr:hypothetical protein [Geminicoccaceae bacterium]
MLGMQFGVVHEMADLVIEAPRIRDDGLQLEEDRAFQERFWRGERIALGVFAIIILLALLGFAGSGGLLGLGAVASSAGSVEHARVVRWQTPDRLRVVLTLDQAVHEVVLADPFSAWFDIETIQPEPERSFIGPHGLVLQFNTDGVPSSAVLLSVRPDAPGLARYRVVLDGAEPMTVTQLVLP